MKLRSMLDLKKLTLIAMMIASHSVSAENLLLQCEVSGKYDDERLDPATILVTIFPLRNLFIDIDGPADYANGVGANEGEHNGRIYKGRDESTDSTFAVYQTVLDTRKNTSSETRVSVNRVTGMLSVLSYFRIQGRLHSTEYSGKCFKVTNSKKF